MPKIAIFARWSWTRLWGAVATHRAGLQRETFFSRQSNTYILIWYEDVFCFSSYGIQFQGVALSLPWTKVWQNTEEKWIEYKINAIFELSTLESPCIDSYYGLICPAPCMNFIFLTFWSCLPNSGTTCNTYLYFKCQCLSKVGQSAIKIHVCHMVSSNIPLNRILIC